MATTGKSFLLFKATRSADLRRIARRSCGDYTEEDAGSEAWLIAKNIERKRGFAVDFSNSEDQDLVLAWLHRELVDFSEKHIRFAVKLDQDWDSDDPELAATRLEKLLATPEQLDPLFLMQASQEHGDLLELVKLSYSQAAAYVILLDRFDWDLETLATHLRIVAQTVRSRLIAVCIHLKHQASLFDRIQAIDHDFVPTVARGVVRRPAQESTAPQLQWDFS